MKKPLVAIAMIAILAGCSSQAPKPAEKPDPKPTELATGRTAFQNFTLRLTDGLAMHNPIDWNRRRQRTATVTTGKAAVWRRLSPRSPCTV